MSLSVAKHYYQLGDLNALKMDECLPLDVPQPFLSLLYHPKYMTATLSTQMQERLKLNRLQQIIVDNKLLRVIKLEKTNGTPVMLAFIEIYLSTLTDEVAEAVVTGKEPLGRLLEESGIPPNLTCEHLYKAKADAFLSNELKIDNDVMLYGRNSFVRNLEHQLVANSFELLSPVVASNSQSIQAEMAGK